MVVVDLCSFSQFFGHSRLMIYCMHENRNLWKEKKQNCIHWTFVFPVKLRRMKKHQISIWFTFLHSNRASNFHRLLITIIEVGKKWWPKPVAAIFFQPTKLKRYEHQSISIPLRCALVKTSRKSLKSRCGNPISFLPCVQSNSNKMTAIITSFPLQSSRHSLQ